MALLSEEVASRMFKVLLKLWEDTLSWFLKFCKENASRIQSTGVGGLITTWMSSLFGTVCSFFAYFFKNSDESSDEYGKHSESEEQSEEQTEEFEEHTEKSKENTPKSIRFLRVFFRFLRILNYDSLRRF
ncbi:unnamed protein product [Arabis nemorensis]|uniref:Uncharacterized protein n=1 Tax=Arabis nemorensis TaxID=586526 RepID=A0A565CCX3_9BRAS|nr:unnamed protein product [Arabis nemorensis]